MKQLIMQYVWAKVVVVLVCHYGTGKVRLYYRGTHSSKLSHKRVTPLVWSLIPTTSGMYVDIPMLLLLGQEQNTSYHYKLKGSAGRYAKRVCKEVA